MRVNFSCFSCCCLGSKEQEIEDYSRWRFMPTGKRRKQLQQKGPSPLSTHAYKYDSDDQEESSETDGLLVGADKTDETHQKNIIENQGSIWKSFSL